MVMEENTLFQTFVELLRPYIKYSSRRSIKKEAVKQCSLDILHSHPSTTQLLDSEMLCKEGRHDFSLRAACVEFISLYLSALIP